jgi:hypothetical protein
VFTTILSGLALLAIIAAFVLLTPSDPWPLDGEIWYEQFGPRSNQSAVAQEIAVMRMDAEAEAIFAASASRPHSRPDSRPDSRPAGPTFGGPAPAAPTASNLGASNRSW